MESFLFINHEEVKIIIKIVSFFLKKNLDEDGQTKSEIQSVYFLVEIKT